MSSRACSTTRARSSAPNARPAVRHPDDRACPAACPRPSRASSSARWGWRRPADPGRRTRGANPVQPGASRRRPAQAGQRQPSFVQRTRDAASAAEAATGIPAASWWRRPRTRPAGAAARSACRRLARTTCSASRPAPAGRAGGRGHHHRVHQRPAAQGDGEVPRLRVSYEESFADYARLMKTARATPTGGAGRPDAARASRRACSGRLRHRPGLRRQADPRHQHDAAPAADARPEAEGLNHEPGSLLSLGTRAMAANYAALQTTGHNIANASVAGYSRQRVELETTARAVHRRRLLRQGRRTWRR
jgi:hypothetical protein